MCGSCHVTRSLTRSGRGQLAKSEPLLASDEAGLAEGRHNHLCLQSTALPVAVMLFESSFRDAHSPTSPVSRLRGTAWPFLLPSPLCLLPTSNCAEIQQDRSVANSSFRVWLPADHRFSCFHPAVLSLAQPSLHHRALSLTTQ